MSSALDTLLAAARYIELQEQQHLSLSSSPPSVRNLGRFHNQNINNSTNNLNTNTNTNNSGHNNIRNNLRHQQISSPLTSPIYGGVSSNNNVAIITNNNNNQNADTNVATGSNIVAASNNHEHRSSLSLSSSAISSGDIARNHHHVTDSRNEEPYLNGQSLPSSLCVISAPPSSSFSSTTQSSSLLSSSKQQQQQQQQQSQQQQQKHKKQQQQQQKQKYEITNNNNTIKHFYDNHDDDDDQIMTDVSTTKNVSNKKSTVKSKNQSEYRLPNNLILNNNNNNNNNSSSSSSSFICSPVGISSTSTTSSTTISQQSNYKFYSSSQNNFVHKKFIPLTPPPISYNKKIEVTRTRSLSFSSNKFTANNNNSNNNNNNNINGNIVSSSSTSPLSLSSSSSSSIVAPSSSITATTTTLLNRNNNNNNNGNNLMASPTAEDSSQSSLNLSSTSGYLSGSSVNSNSNLNLNHSTGVINNNNNTSIVLNSDHHNVLSSSSSSSSMQTTAAPVATGGRRRTTSTNSNGGTQRSPCILRAGTREVHNKLEKHRRAHLKECFEQLKIQLQLKDDEKKKPSNLAILGAAHRHVISLRRRERELEQQVEQLAKEKINAQKKILSLKRELSVKYDNIDFSTIISDGDVGNIPVDRESFSDSASLSSGRGSIRYSSSSSLSSVNTISSPVGSSIQSSSVPATLSPVISPSSSSIPPITTTSPCSPSLKSSSSPISIANNVIPLSLTTKNHNNNTSPLSSTLQTESPIPSTPSPSPSSSSGISCSPITSSASPPMVTNISSSLSLSSSSSSSSLLSSSLPSTSLSSSDNLKLPNVPNGLKLSHHHHHHHHYPLSIAAVSQQPQSNVTIVATTAGGTLSAPIINISTNDNGCLTSTPLFTTNNGNIGMQQQSSPYGFTSQNVQITSTPKDLNGKNGVCNRKTPSSDSSREINSLSTSSGLISVSGGTNIGCAKEIKVEKMFDESEQPTKVIKLFNGIALAPVDKDNKLLSSTPLALSQVVGGGGLVVSPFPVLATQSQGLRVIGAANGLATIELSSPAAGVQSHNNRSQQQPQSMTPSSITTVTSASAGAQLHKLLVSAGTQSQVNHTTVNTSLAHTATVTPELARLPGGAELNILPAGANGSTALYRGNGKLAMVNNGITLKETSATGGRAVHVVTPIQPGGTPISGLTPIVVSQGGQQGNNLAQLIASSPQLAGKVNLSVGGQTLPLISTQYLSSMKPMVVAVAASSNPITTTSVTANGGTTVSENCGSSS